MEAVYAPDKPIFRCGAYQWLNRDETMCIICSTNGNPKILRTAKHSYSALINHIKMHPVQQQKFFELGGMPPQAQESAECPGTSSGAQQRTPRGPYQLARNRSTSGPRASSEMRPHPYETAQRPNDGEFEPAPLSNQELLNHALSAVLNGASGISHGFTYPSNSALNGVEHPDDATVRQSAAKEEAMDKSVVNGTTESHNGTADVARPKDDLRNLTLDQLKEEVLRSEIRRNLSEERRNQSEERRNMAMARFFDSLADRI